jgi:hypothetical protein
MYDPVHLAYNPSYSTCFFFNRNSIFLFKKSTNRVFQPAYSSNRTPPTSRLRLCCVLRRWLSVLWWRTKRTPDRCHRSWGHARLCQIGTGIGHAGCDAPVQRARSRTSLRWRPVACGGNGNPSMGVVMGRGGRLNRPCCRTRLRLTPSVPEKVSFKIF